MSTAKEQDILDAFWDQFEFFKRMYVIARGAISPRDEDALFINFLRMRLGLDPMSNHLSNSRRNKGIK